MNQSTAFNVILMVCITFSFVACGGGESGDENVNRVEADSDVEISADENFTSRSTSSKLVWKAPDLNDLDAGVVLGGYELKYQHKDTGAIQSLFISDINITQYAIYDLPVGEYQATLYLLDKQQQALKFQEFNFTVK
ncbi:MAG: hypothetical protein HRU20_22850 [Pseudomonadales bacterium]|nr:hypothetical protein [Pseudomonadales bacterium]